MDDVINRIFFEIHSENYENLIENYKLVYSTVLKTFKSVPELESKVKFSLKDPLINSENVKAIYNLTHEEVLKPKLDAANKKVKKGSKITFEPEINEKFPVSPTASENYKLIVFNQTFEKIMRSNIVECINKQFKFEDPEKDVLKVNIEEYCISKDQLMLNTLSTTINKDIITQYLENPNN